MFISGLKFFRNFSLFLNNFKNNILKFNNLIIVEKIDYKFKETIYLLKKWINDKPYYMIWHTTSENKIIYSKMFYRSKKLKILISFISFFVIVTEEIFENFIKKKWITRYNSIKVKNIKALFSCNIKNHSILIFEPNPYHYECTPGYSKYFLDLGYNIDIIMQKIGEDAFCLFKDNEKIRLFIYDNLDKIIENSGKLSLVFHNYNYLLIESTDIDKKEFYKKLGFFKMNNSIFVFHNIFYIKEMGIPYYYYQNKIWSLAKFSNTLQVNPHYFGNIKLKQKNNKTRFFITSTLGRNNDYLISLYATIFKDSLKKGLNYDI